MKLPGLPKKLEYSALFGPEDEVLHQDVLEQRRRFVEMMQWRENHTDDRDAYDTKGSLTILQYSEQGGAKKPEVSMRFTQVEGADDILSVQMAQSNEAMHQQAQAYVNEHLVDLIEQGKLYDVTRAVVNEDIFGTKRSFKSLLRLLGYGQGLTAEDARNGAEQWIMTLTTGLHNALVKVGIEPTIIAQGKISAHDNKDSVVCVVCPSEIDKNYKKTLLGSITRKLYENGLEAGVQEKQRRLALGKIATVNAITHQE